MNPSKSLSLYVIQNENHYLNFSLSSHADNHYYLLLLDNFTGLQTDTLTHNCKDNELKPVNNTHYLMSNKSYLSKIICISHFSKQLQMILPSLLREFDEVNIVLGNDGGLQKAVAYEVKKIKAKTSVNLLIDTIMGDREKTLRSSITKIIEPLLHRLRISHYFPSVLGTSGIINKIFVPHSSNKDVLIRRGVNAKKITIQESPRISWLKSLSDTKANNGNILFVAGAWEWHGRPDVEIWQLQILQQLTSHAAKHPKGHKIKIRLHPRQFNHTTEKIDPKYICDSKSLESALLLADTIISFRSSALYDASLIGKDIYILESNAPVTPVNEFMQSVPRIESIKGIFDLL